MPDVYPKCFAEIIILSRMHQSYHVDPVRYHQKKTNCVGKTILSRADWRKIEDRAEMVKTRLKF